MSRRDMQRYQPEQVIVWNPQTGRPEIIEQMPQYAPPATYQQQYPQPVYPDYRPRRRKRRRRAGIGLSGSAKVAGLFILGFLSIGLSPWLGLIIWGYAVVVLWNRAFPGD